jgi:hypothetical protein
LRKPTSHTDGENVHLGEVRDDGVVLGLLPVEVRVVPTFKSVQLSLTEKHAVECCHLVLDGVMVFVDDEPLCVGWLAVHFGGQCFFQLQSL